MRSARLVAVVVALGLLLAATLASARPGGGSSFSRSSSSSSSSSGGSRSWSTSSSSSGGSRSWSTSSSSSSGGSRSWSTSSSSSSSSGSSSWGSTSSTSSSGSGYGSSSYGSSSYGSSSYGSPGYTSTSSSGYVPPSTTYDPVPVAPYAPPPPYVPPADPPPDRSLTRALWWLFLVGGAIVLGLVLLHRMNQRRSLAEWEAIADAGRPAVDEERARRHASIASALVAIRAGDDAFSYVLFEDFLYALYAEAHTARGKGEIERLSMYLSAAAQAKLVEKLVAKVEAIVIGGMRVDSVTTRDGKIVVDVVFTSNMTEVGYDDAAQAYYMEERWQLVRSASARSRPPEKARVIGCPSCGAPLDKTIGAKCGYCGAVASHGEHDWFVERIVALAREERGPMLTGTTEEVGTELPTVVDRDAKRELGALQRRDQAFSWPAFVARVDKTFHAFHRSWAAQDLKEVRPYLSDNLYELQRYWVQAYEAQGLRNVTEKPYVVTVHLARVTRDRFYEAITVRVFASCYDYTVDASGGLVGGSKDRTREYSEYWTFIRAAGRTGAPRADDACPSCGAPLADLEMAGTCSHCHAKITTGDFDWVLSRIEQDEVYEQAA